MYKKSKKSKKKSFKGLKYIVCFSMLGGGLWFAFPYVCRSIDYTATLITKFVGFSVDNINISNASAKVQALIQQNIGIQKGDNIFKLSAKDMFNNVSKIAWIKSVNIQKVLPNTINIKIEERLPIAIFQNHQKFTLIDIDGNLIEDITTKVPGVPVISGEGANLNAKSILGTISKFNQLYKNLESLTYVRERRWDISISGIKVLLPEDDIEKALETLSAILKTEKINQNTVNKIDLRTPDNVIFSGLKIIKSENNII